MHYAVDPGLYALGQPHSKSPVLVTANYKMSFDALRCALPGRDAWLLVLDTHGINVWCAAGKGTFGTDELVARIRNSGLEQVVTHRLLVLPQLAGPGVAAHLVKKLAGFRAIFGPIRAGDLPAFLDAGFQATPAMRLKTFDMAERAVLIPVELVGALKPAALLIPVLFLTGGIGGSQGYWDNAMRYGWPAVAALLLAVLAGAVITPLLLPWLPGRAFSMKGFVVGLAVAMAFAWWQGTDLISWGARLNVLAWLILMPMVAAFLAMNFTGASTYTSLSGVRKEMRWAVPMQVGGTVMGLTLWLSSRFLV